VNPVLLELGITAAASLASDALQRGYRAGLFMNTYHPNSDQQVKVPPSRSPDQLTLILEALARVNPLVTVPMESFLMRESRNMAWGTTIILITATATPAILASLLRLQSVGRRTSLVLLGDQPTVSELAGIRVYQIKEGAPSALEPIAAST
jgi:uncharacterized protein (DUF58 family)